MASPKKLTYNRYLKAYRANPTAFYGLNNPEGKQLTRKEFSEIVEQRRLYQMVNAVNVLILNDSSGIEPPTKEEANAEFWEDIRKVYDRG